jgi:hypothetical protein
MVQRGEETMDFDISPPEKLVVHQDELVEDFPNHRATHLLFGVIKDLLKRRFQDVERAFYEIDEYNSGKLTQDMMYKLFTRCVGLLTFNCLWQITEPNEINFGQPGDGTHKAMI